MSQMSSVICFGRKCINKCKLLKLFVVVVVELYKCYAVVVSFVFWLGIWSLGNWRGNVKNMSCLNGRCRKNQKLFL